MTTFTSLKCGLLALATGLTTASASAQLIAELHTEYVDPFTARGWYDSEGVLGPDSAFRVGAAPDAGVFQHSFFVFDRLEVPSLQFADIKKATLQIKLEAGVFVNSGTYESSDANDPGALFSLYKFEGVIANLQDGTDGAATFADLGSDAGGSFGSRAVSWADNEPGTIEVDLTAYFLDYINGLSGEFALGGALSNPNDTPAPEDYEFMFLNTDTFATVTLRLEFVPVPEPSTYGLIGAGVLGFLAWRRRAVKAARKG